jgi:hypothetical protein
MQVEDLKLVGKAKQAALDFKAAFPNAVFTSGLRSKSEQASAMASNIALNRFWVAQTYKPSPASKACHAWVLANRGAKTKAAIAAGVLSVLETLPDEELGKLSLHLAGQAFDVKPVSGLLGGQMAAYLHELADRLGGVFLEREGGLVRWHVQFHS